MYRLTVDRCHRQNSIDYTSYIHNATPPPMDLPFPSLGRRWLWIRKKQIHVVNVFETSWWHMVGIALTCDSLAQALAFCSAKSANAARLFFVRGSPR